MPHIARLSRLLRPRSLAVFGGHAAAEVVRQSAKIGFTGEIWPVHPRHGHVAGKQAFRTAADLPAPPDAVFIGVNRHASIDIMREISALGAGGAVAYASGFAEAGDEGRAFQAQLVVAAGAMPFFGPNCYGFINYFDKALCWPDQFGGGVQQRGVAIITQSGNIGLNITMQRRALPIGYLITLGNQAGAGPAAVIHAVLDDPRVTTIGLHMEGLDDPQAFANAVARAHAQNVAVVALKTGRSAEGARIAQSHTASMASGDAVVDAYFRRLGVARVNSIPVLLETLKLLHFQGALPGRSIASLSCSGGEAALIADAAAQAGLHFAPLSLQARAGIEATLPELVSVSNPLDYHTFGWRNRQALAATFAAMMRAGADMNLLILDFPRPDTCDTADWDVAANAMADAAQATGRRAAILATLPEAMPENYAERLAAQGLVPLFGMVEALSAIDAAASAACHAGTIPLLAGPATGDGILSTEFSAKRALSAFGVNIPGGVLAITVDGAEQVATSLGFPVAAKASAAMLAHKTEAGAVKLNLYNAAAVRHAAEALFKITSEILIEPMITGTVAELIVGIASDPVLGLYLVIGAGGILAELLHDSATLLLPVTRQDVESALNGLRVARLLNGFRGAPAADIPAAIDAILAIQKFALAHAETLHELDVNPLMVRAAGHGAVAADVLLRMATEPTHV